MKTFITFSIALFIFAINEVNAKNPQWNVTTTSINGKLIKTNYQAEHFLSMGKKVTVLLVIYTDAKTPNKMVTVTENEQTCSEPVVTTVSLGKDCYKPFLQKKDEVLVFNFEDQYEKNVPIEIALAQK
jgi:hypothetical protein